MTACEFVPNEIVSRYDHDRNVLIDETFDPVGPCFIEANPIDAVQKINPRWRLANLIIEPSIKSAALRPSNGAPNWARA